MEEDEEDPVPVLTRYVSTSRRHSDTSLYRDRAHFEEAMQSARRSVSDVEVRRYEAFAQQMKQTGGSNFFRFPTEEQTNEAAANGNGFGDAGNDDSLYD